MTSLWNGTYHSSQIVLDPEFNITYPLIGIELKIEDVSDQQNSFSVTFDNDLTSVLGFSKENTYKLDGDVGSNIVLREKDISTVPFFKNQVIGAEFGTFSCAIFFLREFFSWAVLG